MLTLEQRVELLTLAGLGCSKDVCGCREIFAESMDDTQIMGMAAMAIGKDPTLKDKVHEIMAKGADEDPPSPELLAMLVEQSLGGRMGGGVIVIDLTEGGLFGERPPHRQQKGQQN